MGLFDFFKMNKNIENDNGLNKIYFDSNPDLIHKKFELVLVEGSRTCPDLSSGCPVR